jgi:hypothetical protein
MTARTIPPPARAAAAAAFRREVLSLAVEIVPKERRIHGVIIPAGSEAGDSIDLGYRYVRVYEEVSVYGHRLPAGTCLMFDVSDPRLDPPDRRWLLHPARALCRALQRRAGVRLNVDRRWPLGDRVLAPDQIAFVYRNGDSCILPSTLAMPRRRPRRS